MQHKDYLAAAAKAAAVQLADNAALHIQQGEVTHV
jgi:hypothetical protein